MYFVGVPWVLLPLGWIILRAGQRWEAYIRNECALHIRDARCQTVEPILKPRRRVTLVVLVTTI